MKSNLRLVRGLFLGSALATAFAGCGDDGPDDTSQGGSGGKAAFHTGGKSAGSATGGHSERGGAAGSAGAATAGDAGAGNSGTSGSAGELGNAAGAGGGGAGGEAGEPSSGGSKGGAGGKSGGGSSGGGGTSGGGGKSGGGTSGGGGVAGNAGAANKCGNGKVDDPLEQCDRGGAKDGCSASCTLVACDQCRTTKIAGTHVSYLTCNGFTVAEDKQSCEALLTCIRRTHCAEQYLDLDGNADPRGCYCGNVVADDCFSDLSTNDTLQGACKNETVDAARTKADRVQGVAVPGPLVIRDIIFDISANAKPVGPAYVTVSQELSVCTTECTTCSSCEGLQCNQQSSDRRARCSGANAAKCDTYRACLDQNNCLTNPRSCYCGTVDETTCFADAATSATPKGTCRDAANALAGTDVPKQVKPQFDDSATALGAIGKLLTCSESNCQALCHPAASSTGGGGGTAGNGGTAGGGTAGKSGGTGGI